MKTALTPFDLKALVIEWQDLVGGYVDKVYQRDDEVILRIHVPNRGKAELYSKAGRWLCLHGIEEKPGSPPPFAQALRRLLDNARITSIDQRGIDRIAMFELERGPEKYRLIFEIFGKGNVVVIKDSEAVAAEFPHTYKDRTVRPGKPYGFPPMGPDPLEADRAAFDALLRSTNGPIVKVLAARMGLGGQVAEELCLVASVSKETKTEDLSPLQVDGLYTALNNLAAALEQERRPSVILQDGQAIDAIPIDLALYAGFDRQAFPTFNEALSHFLRSAPPEAPGTDELSAKYERRIDQQEESLRALREETGQLEARAHFLYAHYAPFDELLKAIREGREPPANVQIKGIDRKARTVTLAVGDFESLTLDYEKDVTANAQDLYERRREAQLKAQRVEEALVETRRERDATIRKAEAKREKPKVRPTKSMWFDAYRWTLSSEGYLILGGRDAKSNDQLVKKHLKEFDRYAHADLHGAPSVVVKKGGEAGEATLREACEFALAYSKAWSSGLSSGSAYWVLPEQVSKQAEAGEYLPRGAFMIRGKRNYVHDLPVRLALGEVEVEGHAKVMAGPVSAVAARAPTYVVLGPGREDRDRIAKRLADALHVPIEEVARALPAGGLAVVEAKGLPL